MRMRCIEMVMGEQGRALKEERVQARFARYYDEARDARRRFLKTEDLLARILSGERFWKELKRYREHILEPFGRYDVLRNRIEKIMHYRRPDRAEIESLKDFLSESFLKSMEWLSESRKAG
jgi:hypothetical protein